MAPMASRAIKKVSKLLAKPTAHNGHSAEHQQTGIGFTRPIFIAQHANQQADNNGNSNGGNNGIADTAFG